MILFKLLKDQTLSFKLTAERQNIVQANENITSVRFRVVKWWGVCDFRIFRHVFESFLLFMY